MVPPFSSEKPAKRSLSTEDPSQRVRERLEAGLGAATSAFREKAEFNRRMNEAAQLAQI